MEKDLFQIAQMQDIYFTVHMWAMLSPRLANTEFKEQKPLTNHKRRIRGSKGKTKPA